jgi:hypothetical protein
MRLDLSKEQINYIVDSLYCDIKTLIKEGQELNIKGSVEDKIKEAITVEKSTLLYLQDVMKKK